MRLAVVADIHSNLHALEAAEELIDRESVDHVLCAGDIVGYGAFPNECCDSIRRLSHASICGNHDRSALSREVSRMNPYAAAAALWTSEVLRGDSRDYLGSLQGHARLEVGGAAVAMFHGSPSDPDEYVYEEMVDGRMLERGGGEVVVMGHTHVPYVWSTPKGVVVNPGSVGQPRDRDPRGSMAFLDTESLSCSIVRFQYPVDAAAEAILAVGLPRVLAERLAIGW